MRTKTNNWTKKQNARRYFLHQNLKAEFEYSAKGRTVQVTEEQLKKCSETARWAVRELQEVFGYNIQVAIPTISVGQLVRLNNKFIIERTDGRVFRVDELAGRTAMCTPTSGRWRKQIPVKIKFLIPVNETTKKNGRVQQRAGKSR